MTLTTFTAFDVSVVVALWIAAIGFVSFAYYFEKKWVRRMDALEQWKRDAAGLIDDFTRARFGTPPPPRDRGEPVH